MRCSFVHFGDVHLGTQQYDCPERLNDFGRAWLFACEYVANARPDFAICAGDLFNRFTINPVTFDQARAGLSILREAGVPIVDIQGNHDRTRYGEAKSWLDSFADQGLLTHLDVLIGQDGVRLRPVERGKHHGSYVEWSGCRIVGVRYLGASTERVLRELQPRLEELGHDGAFTILVLHAGIEGIVPRVNAELTANSIEPLRGTVDYLALGHLHKHFTTSNLAYNGGSLETWALNEWSWDRGLLHVEVDTSQPHPVTFRLVEVPRRPFVVVQVNVEQYENPRALLRGCFERLERERARLRADQQPVVFVTMRGRLRFGQEALPINQLEDACRENFDPLVVQIREEYDPRDFATEGADDDEPIDRAFLERSVLRDRLAGDERYAPYAADLAALALDLKERALRGEDGPVLVEALREAVGRIDGLSNVIRTDGGPVGIER